MRYELNSDALGPHSVQLFCDDGSQLSIPFDLRNTDFCRFVAWNAVNGHPITLPSDLQARINEPLMIQIHGGQA